MKFTGFLGLELPSQCHKDLNFNLHEENKHLKRINKILGEKKVSNKLMGKMNKDSTFIKSKLRVYDRLMLVFILFVVFLDIVMTLVVMNKHQQLQFYFQMIFCFLLALNVCNVMA